MNAKPPPPSSPMGEETPVTSKSGGDLRILLGLRGNGRADPLSPTQVSSSASAAATPVTSGSRCAPPTPRTGRGCRGGPRDKRCVKKPQAPRRDSDWAGGPHPSPAAAPPPSREGTRGRWLLPPPRRQVRLMLQPDTRAHSAPGRSPPLPRSGQGRGCSCRRRSPGASRQQPRGASSAGHQAAAAAARTTSGSGDRPGSS